MICADIEIMQISLGSANDAPHYKCIIDFLQRIAVLRHYRANRDDLATHWGALTASSAISSNCFAQSPVLDFAQAVNKDGQ
jgi:hypothetical protein